MLVQGLSVLVVFCVLESTHALIVPDEVPSLLSLVYSNIPPIRKGTDSRLGWGFRLGDHADFQVLVELGPQTNTRPLGNEKDKNGDNTQKRHVPDNLKDALYAHAKLRERQAALVGSGAAKSASGAAKGDSGAAKGGSEAANWLQRWSQSVRASRQPEEGEGEIDARLVIPPELEELYGKAGKPISTTTTTTTSTTTVPTTTTALDDVDLE